MTSRRPFKLLALSLLMAGMPMPLKAEEDVLYYELFDAAARETVDTFSSYQEARYALDIRADEYDNLSIRYDGRILYAEHALVLFDRSDDCSPVSYIHSVDRTEAGISGCYAVDAAFLESDGEKAEFMIAADRGWVSLDDVTILPVEEIAARTSVYTVFHSYLYHEIKNEMVNDNYFSIIPLSEAPSYLKDDTSYYSYDGHYFYEDLDVMLDDLKNGTYENSVNPDDPRYDYYQYVSHRTLTPVSPVQAEKWLRETMMVKGAMDHYQSDPADGTDDTLTRSQLYGQIPVFWQYQYEYGVNALMMLAEAMEESNDGRSLNAYSRNNLYGHAAYDSEEEATSSRFQTVSRSILSHARYYLSGNYLSPLKKLYQGGNYGNKSAGMNVDYSADPYWGELLASRLRQLEAQFGVTEAEKEMVAIRTREGSVAVRREPNDWSYTLYRTNGNPDNAFTVTGIVENAYGKWYRVQSDATLSDEMTADLSYLYDYETDQGYIRADEVQIVLNEKDDFNDTYYSVVFDAGEGMFEDGRSTVELKVREGCVPAASEPVLNHALFAGWDQEVLPAAKNCVYRAVYRQISSALLSDHSASVLELNDRIDLHGRKIDIIYDDLGTGVKELNTSMISGFDMQKEGDQYVNISFAGYSFSFPILISARRDSLREEVRREVLSAIETYKGREELSSEEAAEVVALKLLIEQNVMPRLTQSQFRQFDRIVRLAVGDRIRYIIDPNDLSLAVSGLSLSIPFGSSLDKLKYFEDTYRLQAEKSEDEIFSRLFSNMAAAMKSEMKEMFSLRLLKNYHNYDMDEPILVSIDKPSGSEGGDIFTVLYIDKADGHIYRCYTRQSENMISFLTKGMGTYAVVSRNSSNLYPIGDPQESLSEYTCSADMEAVRIRVVIGCFAAALLFALWLMGGGKRKARKLERRQTERTEQAKNEAEAPSDTTTAMQKFDTQMLNIAKIREADREYERQEAEKVKKLDDKVELAFLRLFETAVLNLEEIQEEAENGEIEEKKQDLSSSDMTAGLKLFETDVLNLEEMQEEEEEHDQ